MSNFKVLFVCSGNARFGISPIVKSQGDSLIKNGIDLKYFTINGKGLKGYLIGLYQLRRYLTQNKFDIIHAHYGLSGITSYFAKKSEKLVVSLMGGDIFESYNTVRTVSIKSKFFVKLNLFFARRFYDYIIVKSEEMKRTLYGVKNLEVIPNGVNFDVFKPLNKSEARRIIGIEEDKKLIIFVADPNRIEKNFKLAKNAFNLLNLNKKQLLTIFDKPQHELANYYSAADVLIFTSFREGSPNVIKEAMACNCPIVTTDVGDVRTVIGNTNGCYIVSYQENDIAKKLINAVSRSNRTDGRFLINHLNDDEVAKKIISKYQKLIKIA